MKDVAQDLSLPFCQACSDIIYHAVIGSGFANFRGSLLAFLKFSFAGSRFKI